MEVCLLLILQQLPMKQSVKSSIFLSSSIIMVTNVSTKDVFSSKWSLLLMDMQKRSWILLFLITTMYFCFLYNLKLHLIQIFFSLNSTYRYYILVIFFWKKYLIKAIHLVQDQRPFFWKVQVKFQKMVNMIIFTFWMRE